MVRVRLTLPDRGTGVVRREAAPAKTRIDRRVRWVDDTYAWVVWHADGSGNCCFDTWAEAMAHAQRYTWAAGGSDA